MEPSGEEGSELDPTGLRFQDPATPLPGQRPPLQRPGEETAASRGSQAPRGSAAAAEAARAYRLRGARGGGGRASAGEGCCVFKPLPLLSHSPLAWVCPALAPSLSLRSLFQPLNKNCTQLPRRPHCPAGPQPPIGSGRPARPALRRPPPSAPDPALAPSVRSHHGQVLVAPSRGTVPLAVEPGADR